MVVSTRKSTARKREERPKACRPTEDHQNPDTDEDTTPYSDIRNKKNNNREIDLSWFDKARLRVIAAAVFGFRCLLTLEPGLTNRDLNFVHFLAKTTAIVVLLCLECAWGLYPGHLNVNSYLNIDIMRMDLHHSFDAGIFFFLPTSIVLQKILVFTEFNASKTRTRDKKKFYEEFSDTTWTYHFHAVSFDPKRSIHRRNVDTSMRIPSITRHPDKGGYTEHSFPFTHSDIQNLTSHVHPFFVTANAYMHMCKLDEEKRERMMSENEALHLVWKIGQLWLKPVPDSFKDTRKGGKNAMADPEKDSESFLADKDSDGKVKYQKKEVFYRRLMDWADNQRSVENVFSRTSVMEEKSEGEMELVVPELSLAQPRRRTRSSTISQRTTEDANVQNPPSAKRKRALDHTEGPSEKKGKANSPIVTPVARRSISENGRGKGKAKRFSEAKPFDLEPAIASYPDSLEGDVEDGSNYLLDFISAQISTLRKGSTDAPESALDHEKVADIAFKVLDSQSTIPIVEKSLDIEDLAAAKTLGARSSKLRSSPIKKSPSSASLSSRSPFRSSTLTLAHVEIETPKQISLTPSLHTEKPSSREATLTAQRKERSTTLELDTEPPARIRRGRSVAPEMSEPSSPSKTSRFMRALSTPPMTRSPSLSILAKVSRRSATLARINNLDDSKPADSDHSTRNTGSGIKKRSSSPPPPPLALDPPPTNDCGDISVFVRAGKQAIFVSLANEFGLSVDEVSGVYDELGDLEKTKRILSRISRSKGSDSVPLQAPSSQTSPKRSPSKNDSRSQSLAPSISSSSFSTPTRTFLTVPKKKNLAAKSARRVDTSDEENSADESDGLPERFSPKRKTKANSSGYTSKRRKTQNMVVKEVLWTPESRLDSLTRSIEMILRTGTADI